LSADLSYVDRVC